MTIYNRYIQEKEIIYRIYVKIIIIYEGYQQIMLIAASLKGKRKGMHNT